MKEIERKTLVNGLEMLPLLNRIGKVYMDRNPDRFEPVYDDLKALRQKLLAHFSQDQQHVKLLDPAFLEQLAGLQDEDGYWRFLYDEFVPSDVRVDYWYWPTYMATAALMHEMLVRAAAEGVAGGQTIGVASDPASATADPSGVLPETLQTALRKGLDAACGRRLCGHGVEAEIDRVDALNFYIDAGLVPFLERFPDCSPAFTAMIREIIGQQRQDLLAGRTIADWNEDFSAAWMAIQAHFQPIDTLFVYGSLMSGQAACRRFLTDMGCRRVGTSFLSGYHLYDLGAYPAILPASKFATAKQATPASLPKVSSGSMPVEPVALVCGEVFTINDEALQRTDAYEGEGTLYRRQPVVVRIDGQPQIAWTYVFNDNIEPGRLVPLGKQPWQRGCMERAASVGAGGLEAAGERPESLGQRYIWYAAYGSNCLFERFRCYIEGGQFRNLPKIYSGCSDTTLPLADRPFELPYDMYFANRSPNWDSSVCFLDHTRPGHAYGRIFLVTVEQFRKIHIQEGRGEAWYDLTLTLGEVDGISVKTFTNSTRLASQAPSLERLPLARPYKNYLDVVRKGLLETWGDRLGKGKVERYLEACVGRM